MKKLILASTLLLATLAPAFAATVPVAGEVKKINVEQNKITLKHEPIPNMDMKAMTMVFTVGDPAMLSAVKVGDKVTFEAERVKGKITIISLKVN